MIYMHIDGALDYTEFRSFLDMIHKGELTEQCRSGDLYSGFYTV